MKNGFLMGIYKILHILSLCWHFEAIQGKKNPGTDRQSVEGFLRQVLEAKEMKIDKYVLAYVSCTGKNIIFSNVHHYCPGIDTLIFWCYSMNQLICLYKRKSSVCFLFLSFSYVLAGIFWWGWRRQQKALAILLPRLNCHILFMHSIVYLRLMSWMW